MTNAALWTVLVRDTRSAESKVLRRVDDAYMCLYETFFSPAPTGTGTERGGRRNRFFADDADASGAGRASQIIREYGDTGRDLVRCRVLARLVGTPEEQLPKYPADVRLSEDQVAALKAKLSAVTTRAQAAEAISSLTIYERASLPGLLRGDAVLNGRLAVLANTLARITADEAGDGVREKLKVNEETCLTPELVQDLEAYVRTQGEQKRVIFCLVSRREAFGGCEISIGIEATPESRRSPSGQAKKEPTPFMGMTGLVCAPGVYGAAQWRLSPPPAKTNGGTFLSSDPDTQRSFRQAMEKWFSPSVEVSAAGLMKFQIREVME